MNPFVPMTKNVKPPNKTAPSPPTSLKTSTKFVASTLPEDANTIEEEVAKQEQLLANQLDQRLKTMQLESKKLAHAKRELERMGFDHRKDIDVLRAKIETNSRELSYANSHLRQKEKEHQAAALEVERLSKAKDMLTEHLRVIIYDNEKKKKKKLAELMSSLGEGGVSGGGGVEGLNTSTTNSPTVNTTKSSPPKKEKTTSWSGF